MNSFSLGRSRWRRKIHKMPFFFSISLLSLFIFLSFSYTEIPAFLISKNPTKLPFPQCSSSTGARNLFPAGEKFLWYSPHSGFSNQLAEFKNAILFAALLNRTLIVPPVLDHHAVALGSCPKFRVASPTEIRLSVWDHVIQLVQTRRLNMDRACFGSLCCAISGVRSFTGDVKQCGSLLSGVEGNVGQCLYAVEEDCRTTVWTYQQDNDGVLDSFQPDEQLRKKKKISFVRRRGDVYKAFGPGSKAEMATVLAFGSLFTAPYRGSELYIDIHEAPRDFRIHSLLQKTEFLPFVPEIMNMGKDFAVNKIKVPFLCTQLRLLDGQFKNHWKATFLSLKQTIQSLQAGDKGKANNPIHIFVMTDLPSTNWTGTYLGDLASDSDSYKLHYLQEGDEMVILTAEKIMAAEHGLRSGFLPRIHNGMTKKKRCNPVHLPDILLYIEEAVCSCASLGFVGTAGSTIAESIEVMRKNSICSGPGRSKS
ncbi:O-fucosyltransferase 30 isoform X2 [Magnolia sinica]|uniref:O-fucosyltransferase 30 isoform X2 n=1 Tax=Magnolia sinica TaxID=86752 RepID=UPI00265A4574|nr:O-fucosyltransferase 30 isoform X2 [Magnolia sinica]